MAHSFYINLLILFFRASKLFESTSVCNIVKEHVVSSFEDLCESESNNLDPQDLYFAVRSSGKQNKKNILNIMVFYKIRTMYY